MLKAWSSEGVQFSSVAKPCPNLSNPMDCSMSGLPVHYQLPELTQTHVRQVSDIIQPLHSLSFPPPPTFNLSLHQGLLQCASSLHHVAEYWSFSFSISQDAMILVFWMLSFKPTFSFSSFTFIERLFNSSSSAMRVVSSAYLRLLIFLPKILIPVCTSSSLTFCMMYSAYKLNKQGDNIQSWCTPFLIWNQSIVSCPVLTVASWPAYRRPAPGGRSGGLVFPFL